LNIEHSFVEYKSDFPPKNDLKAEIVSFLNSRTGGTIFLGVKKDGTVVDFPSHEEKLRILYEYDGFPMQPVFYISDALFKVTLYNKNYYYDQLKLNGKNTVAQKHATTLQ